MNIYSLAPFRMSSDSGSFLFSLAPFSVQSLDACPAEVQQLIQVFEPMIQNSQYVIMGSNVGIGSFQAKDRSNNPMTIIGRLLYYIGALSSSQRDQLRLLLAEWEEVATEVLPMKSADGVTFRPESSNLKRMILRKKIIQIIPIYSLQDLNNYYTGSTVMPRG